MHTLKEGQRTSYNHFGLLFAQKKTRTWCCFMLNQIPFLPRPVLFTQSDNSFQESWAEVFHTTYCLILFKLKMPGTEPRTFCLPNKCFITKPWYLPNKACKLTSAVYPTSTYPMKISFSSGWRSKRKAEEQQTVDKRNTHTHTKEQHKTKETKWWGEIAF